MVSYRPGVAIFGGTFDPVHIGHLRSAVEVREALEIESIRLIPSYDPPHRDKPRASADDRLCMLRLAIDGLDGVEVDPREINRSGKSYMIDTLRSIRAETGPGIPLVLVLGWDAFRLLHEWHEWKDLLGLCHLAVLTRPGSIETPLAPALAAYCEGKMATDPQCLHNKAHGMICQMSLTQIDISSSKVREICEAGRSLAYLVPDQVIVYLQERGLYGMTSI